MWNIKDHNSNALYRDWISLEKVSYMAMKLKDFFIFLVSSSVQLYSTLKGFHFKVEDSDS